MRKQNTLSEQLRVLLIVAILPLIVMIIALIGMLGNLLHEYSITLQNVTTASELNINFKDNLDLDMYHIVVQSSDNADELPLEEVEKAEDILKRLENTTTQKDNLWRLESMLNLCKRLKECMIDIDQTVLYDARMEKLENNIYIITEIIETYMHEYIYVEVHELGQIQSKISAKMSDSIKVILCVGVFIVVAVILYSMRIIKSIIEPLYKLCRKAEHLGMGDFSVAPILSENADIQKLEDMFNKMAERINALVNKIKEDQKTLRKTEMELLQAQINPHFLYNTFDSIIWLAETGQDEQVVEMTTNLSNFFRNSLSKGKDIISLETEKQQVESYLKIQKVRYGDILEYEIDIPNEILGYEIPKLSLQPLVENAIYHGIKNKRGGGKIKITGEEKAKSIQISVEDNGAGMSDDKLRKLQMKVWNNQSHSGLGLRNVHKRLQLYCGAEGGLEFYSKIGEGTKVIVTLPKQNQLSP